METKGRLTFGGMNTRHIYGSDDKAVCTMRAYEDSFALRDSREIIEADARRIVAAWNATRCGSVEALESCDRRGGFNIVEMHMEFVEQHQELLSVLAAAEKYCPVEMQDRIRSAIAKAPTKNWK